MPDLFEEQHENQCGWKGGNKRKSNRRFILKIIKDKY